MYFSRNDYDPAVVSEAQQFRGATAISSSAYFSREEEEENGPGSPGMGGMEGLLADGSLSGLENAARDVIQRVMANPDVQNVVDGIRAGALKVRPNILFIYFDYLHSVYSFQVILLRCLSDDGFRGFGHSGSI